MAVFQPLENHSASSIHNRILVSTSINPTESGVLVDTADNLFLFKSPFLRFRYTFLYPNCVFTQKNTKHTNASFPQKMNLSHQKWKIFHKIQEFRHYSGFCANLAGLVHLAVLVNLKRSRFRNEGLSGAVRYSLKRSTSILIQPSSSATRVSTATTAS